MEEEELIRRLQQLQIEENLIINRLKEVRNRTVKVGDTVKLQTRGVQSTKGDIATVTKVTNNFVYVKVKNTGHRTKRSPKNVVVIH